MLINPQYVRVPYLRGKTNSSFKEWYAFYLGEHSNKTCRRLHVFGTTAVVSLAVASIATQQPKLLLALPLVGYGAAWVGHFMFEVRYFVLLIWVAEIVLYCQQRRQNNYFDSKSGRLKICCCCFDNRRITDLRHSSIRCCHWQETLGFGGRLSLCSVLFKSNALFHTRGARHMFLVFSFPTSSFSISFVRCASITLDFLPMRNKFVISPLASDVFRSLK